MFGKAFSSAMDRRPHRGLAIVAIAVIAVAVMSAARPAGAAPGDVAFARISGSPESTSVDLGDTLHYDIRFEFGATSGGENAYAVGNARLRVPIPAGVSVVGFESNDIPADFCQITDSLVTCAGPVEGVPSHYTITVNARLQIALDACGPVQITPEFAFWGDLHDGSATIGFHERASDLRSPAIKGNCATIVVENRTALDGANTPAASSGWIASVSSARCDFQASQAVAVSGSYSQTAFVVPPCRDYVVSIDPAKGLAMNPAYRLTTAAFVDGLWADAGSSKKVIFKSAATTEALAPTGTATTPPASTTPAPTSTQPPAVAGDSGTPEPVGAAAAPSSPNAPLPPNTGSGLSAAASAWNPVILFASLAVAMSLVATGGWLLHRVPARS